MSCGAKRLSHVPQHFLRPNCAFRVVVLKCGQFLEQNSPRFLLPFQIESRQAVPFDSLGQQRQRMGNVADQLQLRLIMAVDLRGSEVDVNDRFLPVEIPQPRRVLGHVVANRQNQIAFSQITR